tara:strand:- start:1224 stop:1955 length:732 start_codon:yes stop_codon:yes gene_type:complete
MNKNQVVEKLRDDNLYYGDYGKKFLSNSDIATLFSNPLALGEPSKESSAFLVGKYFHTAILEPDKLKSFKIIKSSTRNTKVYKELSGGELCLLEHEVDKIEAMTDVIMQNTVCKDLIRGANVEYEQPSITELFGNKWKGKADIVNHDDKVIVDLKTTADINKFKSSAYRYNYDSQAYIYQKLFGYEFIFIVIDKNSNQIGIFDCSNEFLDRGQFKVERASEIYDLFYKTEDFDPQQYFINKTL